MLCKSKRHELVYRISQDTASCIPAGIPAYSHTHRDAPTRLRKVGFQPLSDVRPLERQSFTLSPTGYCISTDRLTARYKLLGHILLHSATCNLPGCRRDRLPSSRCSGVGVLKVGVVQQQRVVPGIRLPLLGRRWLLCLPVKPQTLLRKQLEHTV